MYHHHFGLTGPPFQLTPAPEALYLSQTHREALAALEWGLLQEPSGLTLLAGESGVGKTTLICSVLARRYRNVRGAFLTNPRLDFDQMMQVVMSQLAPGWSGQTRLELTQGFAELLDHLGPGERVGITIDEAQELSDDALDGLCLLSRADTFAQRRLQIIFVGGLELIARLARPAMRGLNQRIGARALLKPLDPTEVREYIDCRLRAKGGTAVEVFAPAALTYLIAHSDGIPRRVNVLGHNSMLQAYAAASAMVSLSMVKSVVGEYEDLLSEKRARATPVAAEGSAHATKPWPRLIRAALALTMLALAAVGAILIWSQAWLSFYPSPESSGGAAIRPAAEPYMTGPGIPLRPVASTMNIRFTQDGGDLARSGAVPREREPR
jgi:general secretion pathway protein A